MSLEIKYQSVKIGCDFCYLLKYVVLSLTLVMQQHPLNLFQLSVPFHVETSHYDRAFLRKWLTAKSR